MNDLKSLDLPTLIRETVVSPQSAAHKIMGFGLSAHALWLWLGLLTILNIIVYNASGWLYPPTDQAVRDLFAPILETPLLFAIFMFVVLALVSKFLSKIGMQIGGKAGLEPILALVTWLQFLRLLVGLVTLIFSPIIPLLASLFALGAGIWGIYVHVVFIDEAHGFQNRIKAGGLMVLTYVGVTLGIIFALIAVLSLFIGVT